MEERNAVRRYVNKGGDDYYTMQGGTIGGNVCGITFHLIHDIKKHES
jgi:hypothetical protein